jgi:hypothetical protein
VRTLTAKRFNRIAQVLQPWVDAKMGAALKAPPTSRGEVQFGEGNSRTASGGRPKLVP